jgi:hypothetical protein
MCVIIVMLALLVIITTTTTTTLLLLSLTLPPPMVPAGGLLVGQHGVVRADGGRGVHRALPGRVCQQPLDLPLP